MTRGKGVRLQRYKDGGVADARVFAKADGLTWVDSSGRTFTRPIAEIKDWIGERAQAGRLPPPGSRGATGSARRGSCEAAGRGLPRRGTTAVIFADIRTSPTVIPAKAGTQ